MNKKLLKRNCIFKWKIEESLESQRNFKNDFNNEDPDNKDQETVALLSPIYFVAQLWKQTKEKNFDQTNELISQLEESKTRIDEEDLETDHISRKLVEHLIYCTIYCALKKKGDYERAREMKSKIPRLCLDSNLEKGTLCGLKGAVLSEFRDDGWSDALLCLRNAVDLSPKCGLWPYLLATIVRRSKPFNQIETSSPDRDDEKKFFELAYKKSPENPLFALKLANLYAERNKKVEALKIYNNLKDMELTNASLNLRLANGFIECGKLNEANQCLDMTKPKGDEDSSMFFHYMGKYHMKLETTEDLKVIIWIKRHCTNYVTL